MSLVAMMHLIVFSASYAMSVEFKMPCQVKCSSTFRLEIPAFCSVPLCLAVYETRAHSVWQPQIAFTICVQPGSEGCLRGSEQNNLEIKASSCHLLFSFPSLHPLMVHAVCLLFHHLSSCLLSLSLPSLSAADMLVTLFCIFSPAACAGYPVWSNIPGGDRSKLPGKFVIFILNVSIFSRCFLVVVVVVVVVIFVVVVHPYSGTLRLCQCSDTVWHPHEILQRV